MTSEIRTIELPAPVPPMLLMVTTDHPELPSPLKWEVSKNHPLIQGMRVMRMFVVDRGGVEIYSISDDGKAGMRDLIPMNRVRIAQEAMPLNIFIEELAAAEMGGDNDDDDDDDDEPAPAATEEPTNVNGQSS